jgi:hypothetical protein
MENKELDINLEWPVVDEPERAREALQLQIVTGMMKRAVTDDLPVKINQSIVRTFIQVCHVASHLERMTHSDSIYAAQSSKLPMALPGEMILTKLQEMMTLPLAKNIPGMDDIPAVTQKLSKKQVTDIDKSFVLDLDEACDQIWNVRETEQRCERQLQETEDALQRASLLLEMGRESDALREFQRITPDEIRNHENTLDLVELIERFQGKNAALRTLKQWFICEICLHPLVFDLVADILFPGLRLKKSSRINYLKDILFNKRMLPLNKLKSLMVLLCPCETHFIPDRADVETRIGMFGITPDSIDFPYSEKDSICFYSLLTNVCAQLNHLANLSFQLDHRISALMAVDRSILGSLLLLFLPSRPEDIQHVTGFGSYNLCHEWVVENLRESHLIMELLIPRRVQERNFRKQLCRQLDFFREIIGKFLGKSTARFNQVNR